MYDIRFPNLGILLKNILDGVTIFGFEIKFYGIVIALGFVLAYLLVAAEAKRTKQNPELYLDYLLFLIIPAILGARIYYIIFSLDEFVTEGSSFKDVFLRMINTRNGGLAIYGGVIAGIIVLAILAKKRKVSPFLMADTCAMGLLVGQIMGRWGNFFNREAFGSYTDSIFAMAIPVEYYSKQGSLYGLIQSGVINQDMINNIKLIDGVEYIQVHPTFLYESLWNLALLIFIFLYRRNKKFNGELAAIYLWGYGLGRVWIEALRSDSLIVPGINIRASQIVAAACVILASTYIIYNRVKIKKNPVGVDAIAVSDNQEVKNIMPNDADAESIEEEDEHFDAKVGDDVQIDGDSGDEPQNID